MGRQEEAQNLATTVLNDKTPWKSISDFNGDCSLFCEKIVEDAFFKKFQFEELREITKIIMSNPKLGKCRELIETLGETMFHNSGDLYVFFEDITGNANTEILKGPIRNWFIELIGSRYDPIRVFSIVSQHPEYENDSEFLDVLKKNIQGISLTIEEMYSPTEELKPIAEFNEIFEQMDVINALVEWISRCDQWDEAIKDLIEVPAIGNREEIWTKIYPKLEDLGVLFWSIQVPFGLFWLLVPKYTNNEDISTSRQRLRELIQSRGWPLARLSLVSELNAAKWDFDDDEISGEELDKTRKRFFEILGIEDLSVLEGSLELLLRDVTWNGSFEELTDDIFDNAIILLENQIVSGITKNIDVSKLQNTRASKLIPKILEKRKQEMASAEVILHNDSCVDLRLLWRTAYGYEILKSRKFWKFCSLDRFKELNQQFLELGFPVSISQTMCTDPTPYGKSDKDFEQRIDSEASYESITEGLRKLVKTKHPEGLQIAKNLVGSPRNLNGTMVGEIHGVQLFPSQTLLT